MHIRGGCTRPAAKRQEAGLRVFLCEFVSGGGMRAESLPASLAREGALMRDALARDLADLPGISVLTTHDDRLAPPRQVESRAVSQGADAWALWERCAETCDVAWPVAPETGGALARLVELCSGAKAVVVGPDAATVRLTSSKLATVERLAAWEVPCAPAWRPDVLPADEPGPFVSKPDDGAGCEATRFWPERPAPEALPPGHILQRFVAGAAASLTVLGSERGAALLCVNRQHVAVSNGAFAFSGVTVGALTDADGGLSAMAAAIGAALPGLRGLFGVDFVQSASGPVVIEVNPRPTTSYAGLRKALGRNPAGLVAPFAQPGTAAPRADRAVDIRL
jgi:predicted ATP-grasp superfamily ATP-dependent carboligase